MNANELADEFNVENNEWNEDNLRHWGRQAATMLRQQQVEIGCYKIELELHKAMIQDLENALRKVQEK